MYFNKNFIDTFYLPFMISTFVHKSQIFTSLRLYYPGVLSSINKLFLVNELFSLVVPFPIMFLVT